MPGNPLEMEAEYFETCWRIGCFGGFLFSRETLRRMVPRGEGTLLLTGASASMRGKPNFAAFTRRQGGGSARSARASRGSSDRRAFTWRTWWSTAAIGGERLKTRAPEFAARMGEDGLIGLDGLAESYRFLHRQPRNAWTQELDLRTHKEVY